MFDHLLYNTTDLYVFDYFEKNTTDLYVVNKFNVYSNKIIITNSVHNLPMNSHFETRFKYFNDNTYSDGQEYSDSSDSSDMAANSFMQNYNKMTKIIDVENGNWYLYCDKNNSKEKLIFFLCNGLIETFSNILETKWKWIGGTYENIFVFDYLFHCKSEGIVIKNKMRWINIFSSPDNKIFFIGEEKFIGSYNEEIDSDKEEENEEEEIELDIKELNRLHTHENLISVENFMKMILRANLANEKN